ncbi:hypothetical protein DBR42_22895 [Pelomonas sp. HMWF004]|nr:hypothetical protein DBR42_22895 [Pelomonas sp. HMWF004]
MSSHWEWAEQVIAKHDAEKPFAPENGTPLAFKPGDPVIYTNDAGVSFPLKVTGYYQPEQPCSLYATGRRYLLDWDCHWMPAAEASLRHDTTRQEQRP